MAFSTSEKRLTRSQVLAEAPVVASKNPYGASTPSSATPGGPAFSKAGRRVLAELACNDSPVVGLLPAGTPKDKSSDGGPARSRRALLADMAPTQPACTPLGESLLRSQVQLLLQKVGSDMSTQQNVPCLNTGNVVMASPTMLAAPTPLNTPASIAMVQMPQPDSRYISTDTVMEDTKNPSLSALVKESDLHDEINSKHDGATLENNSLESGSTTLCTEKPPPLLLEVIDPPSSTEIFPGKRVLHFDDDTPCKSNKEEIPSRVSFPETPAMRQLDDDEASEWSVNVNVGSPVEKQCQVESSDSTEKGHTRSPGLQEASVLHEHVKMMQQEPSSKVYFLWDEDMERKEVQSRRAIDRICEADDANADDENEDEVEYSEEYYSQEEGEDGYGGEDCDDLCDMLRDMGFEEEKQGLPRGEGKHLRFLYDEDGDDEIVEAMEVKGEEDVSCSGEAVRLKGLPVPMGRHWRFTEDEEDEKIRT